MMSAGEPEIETKCRVPQACLGRIAPTDVTASFHNLVAAGPSAPAISTTNDMKTAVPSSELRQDYAAPAMQAGDGHSDSSPDRH